MLFKHAKNIVGVVLLLLLIGLLRVGSPGDEGIPAPSSSSGERLWWQVAEDGFSIRTEEAATAIPETEKFATFHVIRVHPNGRMEPLFAMRAFDYAVMGPRGGAIAAVALRPGEFSGELWVADKRGERLVARDASLGGSFSPDGDLLAWVRSVGASQTEIVLTDLLTGMSHVLTEGGQPSFSPDGRKIAFVSARSSLPSLWVTSVEGGPPRQVTNVGLSRNRRLPEGFVDPPHEPAGVRW